MKLCVRRMKELKKVSLKAALHFYKEIKHTCRDQAWPPRPEELNENYVEPLLLLKRFLTTLCSGSMKCFQNSTRIQKLVWSFCQDIIYGATNGKIMTSKHILLSWAVKTLIGNVEVIKIMNRLGHGILYSKLEEVDTAVYLQNLQVHGMSAVAIPFKDPFVYLSCTCFR